MLTGGTICIVTASAGLLGEYTYTHKVCNTQEGIATSTADPVPDPALTGTGQPPDANGNCPAGFTLTNINSIPTCTINNVNTMTDNIALSKQILSDIKSSMFTAAGGDALKTALDNTKTAMQDGFSNMSSQLSSVTSATNSVKLAVDDLVPKFDTTNNTLNNIQLDTSAINDYSRQIRDNTQNLAPLKDNVAAQSTLLQGVINNVDNLANKVVGTYDFLDAIKSNTSNTNTNVNLSNTLLTSIRDSLAGSPSVPGKKYSNCYQILGKDGSPMLDMSGNPIFDCSAAGGSASQTGDCKPVLDKAGNPIIDMSGIALYDCSIAGTTGTVSSLFDYERFKSALGIGDPTTDLSAIQKTASDALTADNDTFQRWLSQDLGVIPYKTEDFLPSLPKTECTYEVHTIFNVMGTEKTFNLAPCDDLAPLRNVLKWAFGILTAWLVFRILFKTTSF